MKSFLVLLFISSAWVAQADPADSTIVSKIVNDGNTKVMAAIKNQTKELVDTLKSVVKPLDTVQNMQQSDIWSYLLCFFPIMFFSVLVIGVGVNLKRDNIRLAHFLIDKEQLAAYKKEDTKARVASAQAKEAMVRAASGNPDVVRAVVANLNQVDDPNLTVPPDPSQSTSRLILFFTGITALLIAVCMTSFYFYRWSLGDQKIDFGNLSTVLYGLGLGVLPYGFTKIASVLK